MEFHGAETGPTSAWISVSRENNHSNTWFWFPKRFCTLLGVHVFHGVRHGLVLMVWRDATLLLKVFFFLLLRLITPISWIKLLLLSWCLGCWNQKAGQDLAELYSLLSANRNSLLYLSRTLVTWPNDLSPISSLFKRGNWGPGRLSYSLIWVSFNPVAI